jgi:hypothetical protein
MRVSLFLSVLLLWLPALLPNHPSQAQVGSSLVLANATRHLRQQPLRLTAEIVSQKHCAGDAELDALHLGLRLVYTNTGRFPIVLYKGSDLVSRVVVSRTLEDVSAGRFEVNATLTSGADGGELDFECSRHDEAFVVLQPGETYRTDTEVTIFAVRNDVRDVTGAIKSGDHFLQIEVPTWPGSKERAAKLSTCWGRRGVLWSAPLTSMPMPLRVDNNRYIEECP